jgi:GDPmannose 4,6-dehydratase
MHKKALITGITGQDGAYLAELLLKKGYEVYGGLRRTSTRDLYRLKYLKIEDKVKLIDFELLEQSNVTKVIKNHQFDEVYNLAAQSFVHSSFDYPVYTSQASGVAVTYILEAIKEFSPKTKFYQASTSEMFGKVQAVPQNEDTPFYPRSPYGVAKLYAHWMVTNYRESYGIYACSGILFNHESPLRGTEFVTRKIARSVAQVKSGKLEYFEIGNLDAKRDWGFAGDYVEGMWLMLNGNHAADDFVLATGVTNTVRSFIEKCCSHVGISIRWEGANENEIGIDKATNKVIVKVNKQFYRPAEVDLLIGSPLKALEVLKWKPKVNLDELVKMMMEYELKQ